MFRMKYYLFIVVVFTCLSIRAQDTTFTESQIQTQSVFIEAIQNKLIDRHDLSIPQFREILKKEPNNHVVWYELGNGLYKTKKTDEALDAIKKANDLYPNQKTYLWLLASVYQQKMDYKQEAATYKKLQALEPLNESIYTQWLLALNAEGSTEESIRVLNLLEKSKGINEISSLQKASIYSFLGKSKEEEEELLKLNKTFPGDLKYMHALAAFYTKSQKQSKAEEVFKRILELYPYDERASLALATTMKQAGQDDQYLQAITSLIENPSISLDVKILELIPYLNKAIGKNDKTLLAVIEKHANILATLNKNEPKCLALLGDIYGAQGNDYNAFKSYAQAVRAGRNPKSVWKNYLELASKYEPPLQFKSLAESAFDQFPNEAYFAIVYSKALISNHEIPEARSIIQQAGLMAAGKKDYTSLLSSVQLMLAEEEKDNAAINDLSKSSLTDLGNKWLIEYHIAQNANPQKLNAVIQQAVKQTTDSKQFDSYSSLVKNKNVSASETGNSFACEFNKKNMDRDMASAEDPDFSKTYYVILSTCGCNPNDPVLVNLRKKIGVTEEFNPSASNSNESKKARDKDDVYQELSDIVKKLKNATTDIELSKISFELAFLYLNKLNDPTDAISSALDAIKFNPNWGLPYLLIGDAYIAQRDKCDDWSRKLVAIAALDKFNMAKKVDANATEQADRQIKEILPLLPEKLDAIKLGVKEGQILQIKCINESVKLRFKN